MTEEDISFECLMSESWVMLPHANHGVKAGRWARSAAKRLIKMHGEKPQPGAAEQLTGQLAGWAQVSIDDMAHINQALALTNVPPVGVDALGYLVAIERDDEFRSPEDVELVVFDLHATEQVTPRTYESVSVPLGPGVKTFTLRRSSFNGAEADVRNVDYFIFPHEYPGKFVVLGAYWPNPEFDEYIMSQLEGMAQTLTLSVTPVE